MRAETSGWPPLRAAWWIAGCVAWLALTAWVRPLTAPDEGRYVGVALSMLHSGDWLVPRLDGLPFFHKPPLFYWLSAAAMAVAGPHEGVARVPSMLGAGLAAGSLLLFLRRWSTPALAQLSTLILVTTPFFFIGAQFANLDMLVAGCISATVLLGAGAILARERGEPWRALLAGAFVTAALGLLAKGLIGLLLPGLVLVFWCLVTRRARALRVALWLPGWAVLLALAGPWFVAMQLKFPDFFDYFVITQHFRRFASSGFNNQQAVWFYLPVLAVLTLPWFAWALLPRPRSDASASARRRLSDIDWLMVIWFAVVVVFFSLPRSKLIGYVLPALAPLAYLIARRLCAGRPAGQLRGRVRATAVAAAALCIAVVGTIVAMGAPPAARLRLPAGLTVGPDDQVLMLDGYFYEIPFYWRLHQPVRILSDWQAGDIDGHDDWRKEIADAARFDPARAAYTLVERAQVAAVLCQPRTTWLIGPSNALLANPWITNFPPVAVNERVAAWRFAGSAQGDPDCLGPKAAPALTSGGEGKGDSYDNALAETINGLYKTELILAEGHLLGKRAAIPP